MEAARRRVEGLSRVARQLSALNQHTPSYPRAVNLNALVEELCSALRQRLPPDIGLVTNLSTELAEIRADPKEITRAIESLAVRAQLEMAKGGEIQIKTRNCAYVKSSLARGTERYITLTITNTAAVSSQNKTQQLFEPQTDAAGGVDLDLYLVHR